MITKTVIQSSGFQDVIKMASALLAYGRYYQDAPNELSRGVQSLLWHYFIYNKNKNGTSQCKCNCDPSPVVLLSNGIFFYEFHFGINFDINACQAVEIELNQVSLFLFELTCRKW